MSRKEETMKYDVFLEEKRLASDVPLRKLQARLRVLKTKVDGQMLNVYRDGNLVCRY